MELSRFYHDNFGFHTFDISHILAVLVCSLVGWWLIHTARTKWNYDRQNRASIILAWSLCIVTVGWIFIRVITGQFKVEEDLPLNLCNICAILMPVLAYTKSEKIYNIFYFLVMAGTTQAIITPNLFDSFPHYTFLKYFYVHCGLVVAIIYKNRVFGMRPTIKGMVLAFGAIQLYIFLLMGVNFLIGSNYAFVNHKPATASVLDYMGSYPWYILTGEALAVILFVLFYLPFWIYDRRKAKIGIAN